MSAAEQGTFPSKLKAALWTLNELHISFRGPFITPKENRIFLVDGCILTEAEIVALHECGQFSSENIGRLLSDLKALQAKEPREFQPIREPRPGDKRRSQRVMLLLTVLVKAELSTGETVQTQAFTVSVNAHGGLLESPFGMSEGQKITLVNPQSGKEVGCRVVRVQRSSGEGFSVGFEFEERSPRFWPITFAPLSWGVGRTQRLRVCVATQFCDRRVQHIVVDENTGTPHVGIQTGCDTHSCALG